MKIIEPSFSLHTPFGPLTEEIGIQLLKWVERNARISHLSEDAQTDDTWKRFLTTVVLGHGDWSVSEVSSVTAFLRIDRSTSHQLVRHRIASYVQESQRFCNYKTKGMELEFILSGDLAKENTMARALVEDAYRQSEALYLDLLSRGYKPQEARSILPNGTATTISITGNLRNWRHFLLMRTSKETQEDFRKITIPMLKEFQKCIPILYADIEPNARQIDNLRKAR